MGGKGTSSFLCLFHMGFSHVILVNSFHSLNYFHSNYFLGDRSYFYHSTSYHIANFRKIFKINCFHPQSIKLFILTQRNDLKIAQDSRHEIHDSQLMTSWKVLFDVISCF